MKLSRDWCKQKTASMQAALKLQNSSPQNVVDTKTLHKLEKPLDTFMEKTSIKDTTDGQENPEPLPAESKRAEVLPPGYTLPKE